MSAQLTMGPKEYTLQQAVVRDTPRLYNRGHRTPSALSPSDSVVHVATPGVVKKIEALLPQISHAFTDLSQCRKGTNAEVIMPGISKVKLGQVFNNVNVFE